MNRYEKFEQILNRVMTAGEEIRKNWKSEASEIFMSSFDDSAEYIKKITENCRDELVKEEAAEERETLRGFSFD